MTAQDLSPVPEKTEEILFNRNSYTVCMQAEKEGTKVSKCKYKNTFSTFSLNFYQGHEIDHEFLRKIGGDL